MKELWQVLTGSIALYVGLLLMRLCTAEACNFFTLILCMTLVSFGVLTLILEAVYGVILIYRWWRE